ncbi:MAG: putative domain S-box/diguanylate cyclase protein [Frankiales bacterium]|nr:putative domain S-box/diguanylate cyclase protein [Frankiales bacterium]
MSLPTRARAVIYAVVAFALALVLGIRAGFADQGLGGLGTLALISGVIAAAWARPLIVYRGHASEAVHADEGLLLVALMLLPPQGVLVVVAVAGVAGQVVHQRPLVKAAFNWAQVMVAASLAVLVAEALPGPPLVVALAGVATFFCLSALLIAAIIAVTSATSLRAALLDGAELRLLVLAVGCVLTAPVGLAAIGSARAVGLLPPLYVGMRWVLAGRFDARHDRDRLTGLFDATLAVHRPLAQADVGAELTRVAGELLRCPQVRLSAEEPAEGETSSRIDVEGSPVWLSVAGRQHSEPMDAADQRLLDALAAVGQSALSHAEMYARAQRQRDELTAIMGGLAEGVVAFDASGQPVYVNPAGAALLVTDAALRSGEVRTARDSLVATARRCLRTRAAVSDEAAVFLRFDGLTFPASYTCAPVLDDDGVAVGAVLVFRDVSERIAAERALTHNAFHDQLTGLPNRRLFLDRLDQALLRGAQSGTTAAVLLADIDRFKVFNDNLGQQAGDELIQEIARRIALVTGPSDTIARFGGDEFTVLVEADTDAARLLATRIVDQLSVPVRLSEGRQVVASVSIGIATTVAGTTADDVLHDADVAMSQAKAAGVGGVHAYDAGAMLSRSAHRFDLEADLRTALAQDALEVYYQPKVDLATGEMHDVEALIRWPDPQLGLRMPGEFIPVAEESGLILPLGRFVLTQASRQAHLWAEGGVRVSVAVNLSPRQFQDAGLTEQIETALRLSALPPERLCLEITESLAMQDLELTVRTLHELKALGVELAIDDFGTGHSSLNYLKRFPVDEVKIDRSFVTNLEHSKVDRAIVSAVVGLAEALGIRTVVEGIEDIAQLDWVRELGCSLAQGYHVSRPKPADEVTPLLSAAGRIPAPRTTIDLTQDRAYR